LCLASAEIDEYRRNYIKALKPVFERTLSELVELDGLTSATTEAGTRTGNCSAALAGSVAISRWAIPRPVRSVLICVLDWLAHNAADILSVVSRSWWYVHCELLKGIWLARPAAVSVFIWWMTAVRTGREPPPRAVPLA
jgi:hypothetical protein